MTTVTHAGRAGIVALCVVATAGAEDAMRTGSKGLEVSVTREETLYSSRYSNNGSSPMWCFGNTCIARQGDEVFVSGYERAPDAKPMNDCRWFLMRRTAAGWERLWTDEKGRTREPSPLARLPDGRLFVSANPTLLPPTAAGGGPSRPELLEFATVDAKARPRVHLPGWQGQPPFNQHSYRSMAADASSGEIIVFQNADYANSEWALLKADGAWSGGKLFWPPYAKTDLAPFGATHARVNYPVVVLRNRAVHFCGVSAYDNWDRVKAVADLGIGKDPNAKGESGMAGRQRGNRMRRILYSWTPRIGEKPFAEWLEIDNTFDDGGWLFATDMHVDAAGTVHLLWFRSPMLPFLRDALYKDIRRVYSLRYATLKDGRILTRRSLLEAGEGADPAIPTDLDQVGLPYVLDNGERILGDTLSTPRFHVTPDGRLFVVYYVSGMGGVSGVGCRVSGEEGARDLSENRIIEIRADGAPTVPVTLPLKHPLVQFFTATPRAGNLPSWTLDLLGPRRGGWRPREGASFREWSGEMSYARIEIAKPEAPKPGKVALVGDSTEDLSRMLWRCLQSRAEEQLAQRRADVAALATADAVNKRRERIKAWFRNAVGPWPERTPLNARVVGTIRQNGFRIEKVIYESRPGHHVTASLYVPDGQGPFPGVLVPLGHSDDAKAYEGYQRICILLARRGFAALTFDPIGQGERRQFPEVEFGEYPSVFEHTLIGAASLMVGREVAHYFIWDAMRSLDYLAERPEVDAKRLGCTGISGGGTQTSYLMALDDRIEAAAPGCWITSFERLLPTRGVEDAEQHITGQIAAGMNHGDFPSMHAPKPTLLLAAKKDFFDIQGTRSSCVEAQRLLGVLGYADRVAISEHDVEHGFSQPLRESAAAWMMRWLQGRDEPVREEPSEVLSRRELQCTPTGSVLELKGRSVVDLVIAEAEALAAKRKAAAAVQSREALLGEVRRLLALPAVIPPARIVDEMVETHGVLTVRSLRFATESDIVVPAVELTAVGTTGRPYAVVVSDAGCDAVSKPGGPGEALARQGYRVLIPDLRGWGATRPTARLDRRWAGWFGEDWQEAQLGLMLNRPLLGQRVFDLLAVLRWARQEAGVKAVVVRGCGAAIPVALHAAALDSGVEAIRLDRHLVPWESMMKARPPAVRLADVVPGALEVYDLPDLMEIVADRQ
ncbi:hypothetical protein GX586_12415 [bacterium]|nr:hypothetical protein [bacterium]